MDVNLREGDAVVLPCRRCASLAFRLVIRKGTIPMQCPKCGGTVQFHITESPAGGLEIKSREGQETPGPRVPLRT